MLADLLVLAAGAVAVAVLAALQWYRSARALKMAHTSEELFALFANRALSADEHLVRPFEGVEPGNLDKLDKLDIRREGQNAGSLCDGGQGERISRRKVPHARGDQKKPNIDHPGQRDLSSVRAEPNVVGSTGLPQYHGSVILRDGPIRRPVGSGLPHQLLDAIAKNCLSP